MQGGYPIPSDSTGKKGEQSVKACDVKVPEARKPLMRCEKLVEKAEAQGRDLTEAEHRQFTINLHTAQRWRRIWELKHKF
jgi:hypothetical protein